eukprot:CAMPEP_0168800598 /NCGR_PEP_ID=MMETSP0725-20121227/19096_1 /TAXON_ID=265536 /ORGANISM="Amphiprora sp., Strain CCMP467" /LENGTH=183 /DNA_ID=CAMNT_0008852235 /DNA_START=1121 /DNA_END=1672 /DNA_ORIENTATION=+
MTERKTGTIFVTVGTTLFSELVNAVTTSASLDWMEKNGYTRLIVQYGKGKRPNPSSKHEGKIEIELYDFKPSLARDMADADLVLSHSGAGTVSEVLQQEKPRLVVVVNTLLMDNHQLELAHAMQRREYLYVVESPEMLADYSVWDDFEKYQPKPQDPTDPRSFANILDSFFGWEQEAIAGSKK